MSFPVRICVGLLAGLTLMLSAQAGPAPPAWADLTFGRRSRRDACDLTWSLAGPPAGLVDATDGNGPAVVLVWGMADDDGVSGDRLELGGGRWRLVRRRGVEETALATGVIPEAASLPREVVVRRRERWLSVLLGGRPLCRLPDASSGRGRTGSWTAGAVSAAPTRVQPVLASEMAFADDFVREPDDPQAGQWDVLSGEWQLQSYVDQWRGESPMDPANTARNPNPFVFRGTGDPEAVLLAGRPFWDDIAFAVSVRVRGGTAGLLFGWQGADEHYRLDWGPLGRWPGAGHLVLRRVVAGTATRLAETWIEAHQADWVRLQVVCRGEHLTVRYQEAPVLSVPASGYTGGRIGLAALTGAVDVDDVRVGPSDTRPLLETAIRAALDTDVGAARLSWSERGVTVRPGGAPNACSVVPLPPAPAAREGIDVTVAPVGPGPNTVGICLGIGPGAVPVAAGPAGVLERWRSGGLSRVRTVAGDIPASRLPGTVVLLWDSAHAPNAACRALVRRPGGLEEVAQVSGGFPPDQPLRLSIREAGGALELRDMGRGLILRVPGQAFPAGAPALVAAGTAPTVTFRELVYDGPGQRDWEHPVTTAEFQHDHYMTSWAAREGDWVPADDPRPDARRWWHKGDFFGALELVLPIAAVRTPVGAGVLLTGDDDPPGSESRVLLRAEGDERLRAMVIRGGACLGEAVFPVQPEAEALTVHRDGPFLWIRYAGDEPLAVQAAPADAASPTAWGTQLGLDLASGDVLGDVSLRRDHVLDEQFEGASVRWTRVGRWEMSNKFACDPRWAYLIGESDGLAWLRHLDAFPGDMTLEYYAGMRYRPKYYGQAPYYPRPGDINISLTRGGGSGVFDGYAAVISGWHSRYTCLLREGRDMVGTDRPFVPSTQRIYPRPRELHRRWFYVKLRRRGARFELYLDNRLALSWTDDEPIPVAQLGLWTYDNSIVLARVKISYSRRRSFEPALLAPPEPAVGLAGIPAAAAPAVPEPVSFPDETFDTAEALSRWPELPDDGDARLQWVADPAGGGFLRAVNVYPGGQFRIPLPLAGVDLRRAEALSFKARVSDGARLNLYIKMAGRWHGVTMTGPDTDHENCRRLGALEVGAAGRWLDLRVPLYRPLLALYPRRAALPVAEAWFGVREGDYLLAGLGGNPAGARVDLASVRLLSCPDAARPLVVRPAPADGGVWDGGPVAIEVDGPVPMPLWDLALTVAGDTVTVEDEALSYDSAAREFRFDPRAADLDSLEAGPVAFALVRAGAPATPPANWTLTFEPRRDRRAPPPPRLDQYLIQNSFETGLDGWVRTGRDKEGVEHGARLVRDASHATDGRQSLKLFNERMGGIAGAMIRAEAFHAGKNPLLRFDCRLEAEVMLDLLLTAGGKQGRVTLTDNGHRNYAVPLGKADTALEPDGRWHPVSVDLGTLLGRYGHFGVTNLQLGDGGWAGNPEGATYWVDNVRLVPRLAGSGPHTLSWTCRDVSGISGYSYHWDSDAEAEVDDEVDGSAATTTIDGLPDGPVYVHVKARDRAGNWGPASHWLLLVDTVSPRVASVSPADGAESGTPVMHIDIAATASPGVPGAPFACDLDPGTLRVVVDGKPLGVKSPGVRFDPDASRLSIDLLESGVAPPADRIEGHRFEVAVAPFADATGNTGEGFEWTWVYRRGADAVPPSAPDVTWVDGKVHAHLTFRESSPTLLVRSGLRAERLYEPELGSRADVIRVIAHGVTASATLSGTIDTAVHPYLFFRYRFPPGLSIDLSGTVSDDDPERRILVVELTDAFVRPDHVTRAGRVSGIVCDDRWRSALVDLGARMRMREHLTEETTGLDTTIKSLRFADNGFNWNEPGTEFALDDVLIFAPGPPRATFRFESLDMSGIDEIEWGLSRGSDRLPDPMVSAAPGAEVAIRFPGAGLWYVHARARDTAGNWGEVTHHPYHAVPPVAQ